MRYHLLFYTKHKIKVTTEAVIKTPITSEERTLEKKYLQISDSPRSITKEVLQKLEKDVERFPNNPKLQNYLANYYKLRGDNIMYERVLKATVKQFPDYVFGKVTLAYFFIETNEWEALDELLGKERDIKIFEPYEYIHESLLFNYYRSCIKYAIEYKNFDDAQKYHRILFDYSPRAEEVLSLAKEMEAGKLLHRFSHLQKKSRALIFKPYIAKHLTLTNEAPAFYHPEINKLYETLYDDTPFALIDEIMALPRQTLIEDLEAILLDSIRRFRFLDDRNDMPIHALYFLGALKSYQSLPIVLDVMRQDDEYSDFWFGDFKNKFLYPTLYYLGENQLNKLLTFAKEPNRNIYFISDISNVVSQIALHQRERRAEIIAFYKDLLAFFIKNVNNENHIDSSLIGFIVGDLVDIRATELLEEIKLIFSLEIIDDNSNGNYEEVYKEITKPYHESELNPLPLNIYEFYDCSYEKRKVPIPAEERAMYDAILNPSDPYDKFMQKVSLDLIAQTLSDGERDYDDEYYVPQAPVKRLVPKVGRNEKCPCGSGSKYKNCCGK